MSNPADKSAEPTITMPAAELQDVLTGYDTAMKAAQAEIDSLKAEKAASAQKQAADAALLEASRKQAAAALVRFGVIAAQDEKRAYDQLGSHTDALSILSKSVDPGMRAPKPVGQVVKKANSDVTVDGARRGRANELPEVRAETDDRYLQSLGLQ